MYREFHVPQFYNYTFKLNTAYMEKFYFFGQVFYLKWLTANHTALLIKILFKVRMYGNHRHADKYVACELASGSRDKVN